MKKDNLYIALSILFMLIIMYFSIQVIVEIAENKETLLRFDYAVIYFYSSGKLIYQDINENVSLKGLLIYNHNREYILSFPWGVIYIKDLTRQEYDAYRENITILEKILHKSYVEKNEKYLKI